MKTPKLITFDIIEDVDGQVDLHIYDLDNNSIDHIIYTINAINEVINDNS